MHNYGALHGVLVTFRRPEILAGTLQSLSVQTRQLDTLVIVDNDRDVRVELLARRSIEAASKVIYLRAPDNLGPAGGLALGAKLVLQTADDADWVFFLDDDDPPPTRRSVAELTAFAQRMLDADPTTAGVGLVGARFDARIGLTTKPADEELLGPVAVDVIGGNQLPCYRVAAMREAGVPEPCLFFGFEELEYGLRLQKCGWRLYVDGDAWAKRRHGKKQNDDGTPPNRHLKSLGWREYYSTRNMVWILNENHLHLAAVRHVVLRVVAKAAFNALRTPRLAWAHFLLGGRAAFDAYTGRMGRTVVPAQARESWESESSGNMLGPGGSLP